MWSLMSTTSPTRSDGAMPPAALVTMSVLRAERVREPHRVRDLSGREALVAVDAALERRDPDAGQGTEDEPARVPDDVPLGPREPVDVADTERRRGSSTMSASPESPEPRMSATSTGSIAASAAGTGTTKSSGMVAPVRREAAVLASPPRRRVDADYAPGARR